MAAKGFTLIEVLIALTVLCAGALGGLRLVAVATGATAAARTQALGANLAAARLEQLRALRFDVDASGRRVTDSATDLTVDPAGSGGSGLTPSGPAALLADTPGFVDYLDGGGRWVGGGNQPPRGAVFVRRWSIEPANAGTDLLVLQVIVRPVTAATAGGGPAAGEARFVTLRARTQR